MKRTFSIIRNQMFVIIYLILLFVIVATANPTEKITSYNVKSISSVQAVNLVMKYDPKTTEVKKVKTIKEVTTKAKTNPTKFNGTMTGFGHDCQGCGNSVACPPYPIVTEKITFSDKEYGDVRILAADRTIPCGSMVIVRGSTEAKEFKGIVLDRGGAINGTVMDLLFKNEAATYSFGRQNVEYEIIRWGW